MHKNTNLGWLFHRRLSRTSAFAWCYLPLANFSLLRLRWTTNFTNLYFKNLHNLNYKIHTQKEKAKVRKPVPYQQAKHQL